MKLLSWSQTLAKISYVFQGVHIRRLKSMPSITYSVKHDRNQIQLKTSTRGGKFQLIISEVFGKSFLSCASFMGMTKPACPWVCNPYTFWSVVVTETGEKESTHCSTGPEMPVCGLCAVLSQPPVWEDGAGVSDCSDILLSGLKSAALKPSTAPIRQLTGNYISS